MKIFSFISLWVLLMISCDHSSQTIVGIHIEGMPTDAVGQMILKDTVYEVTFDSLHTARIVMAENFQPGYVTFRYNGIKVPMYVEPGKSFEADLKIENFRVMPAFSGDGAKKNEYLNNKLFRDFAPDYKADEDAVIADLNTQVSLLNHLLDSMAFDPVFTQNEKKRIYYSVFGRLPNYPSYHAYYTKNKDFKPSDSFYQKLAVALPEDDSAMDMEEYQVAFFELLHSIALRDMGEYDDLEYMRKQLAYIDRHIQGKALAELLTDRVASTYVGNAGVDHLDEIAPVYDAKVFSPEKKAAFAELCAKWQKVAKGQPSPDFKYMDMNRKEVTLADFAGKYVFIDVWATWCGPCRAELPHLQNLEHRYKDKNIVFVSISCDQDRMAWQNMVKKEKMGGVQLHTGRNQKFLDDYMITGIPRFILLDREGKIISANMTRPSEPKTITTLDALEGI